MLGALLDSRYRIHRQIGEGGMGAVYEAEHTGTGRRVAVKVITAQAAQSEGAVARLQREARAVGAIDSAHVAQILDAGTDPQTGHPYLVMERLLGEDARQLAARLGPLPPDLALRIVAQACVGLKKAHAARVVHRDIKPANLFLARSDDGEITVKLLDFGIARVDADPSAGSPHDLTLTKASSVLGSPMYMSPEQGRGLGDVDHRTDLWSLGVVLYALLSGRTPYEDRASLGDLLLSLCSEPARPVQDFAPWVRPEVAAVIHRALQRDRNDRFQSAEAMLEAVQLLLPNGRGIRPEMLTPLGPEARGVVSTRFAPAPSPPRLDEPTEPGTRSAPAPVTLFGRTDALAVVTGALDDVAAGRGATVVVSGEAGIGKSALARALAAQAEARGARVAFGRAWEAGGAPAYWPWSQALAELGLDLDELLGSASGEMARAQRVVGFDRVVRAVGKAFEAPVVLILDDLHAADVASLELALAFARAIARRRVLLVVTTRESELLERPELGDLVGKLTREGVAVPLQRLGESATARWLSSVGFHGDASEVHRLSEGNPLFIQEAVRLGVDRFASAAVGGVAVVLAEHLARLSAKARQTLAVASVLGREASHADVAALGGGTLDDVGAAAREGQVAGILSPAGRGALAFSHVLLRDQLYETLPPSHREHLHARAAERVEAQGGPPSLVARHLLAAGEAADAGRVARATCDAVEAAIVRQAADSAIELITSARARLAGRVDEATTLMLDLAEVDATMRTAPSDAVRARCADCAVRAERLGLATERARAALAYGREILTGRVDPRMVGLLEGALSTLPEGERVLRARVLSRLAAAISPPVTEEGRVAALRYARESVAIARETRDAPTLLHALLFSFHATAFLTPWQERLALFAELMPLAREQGADLTIASVGGIHMLSLLESERPADARREAEAYSQLVEALPLPALHWKASAMRATMAALAGRLDEARRFNEALRGAAATNEQASGIWALSEIALCACTRDTERLREIEQELTAALAGRTVGAIFLACAEAQLGKREAALRRLPSLADCSVSLSGIFLAAQTAVFLESRELAEGVYGMLAGAASLGRFFGGLSGAFPFGPGSRLLGEIALLRGDRDRAREHFDAAIAECRAMEAVPFVALCEDGRARAGGRSESPPPPPPAGPPPQVKLALSREGDVWAVTAGAAAPFRVKHSKGMEYLDHLLRSPGCEVYVLVLAGVGEAPEDAGSILDDRARRAYRQRVEELNERLAEAERMGDPGRASRAREELDAVAEELASAVGLGGRDRKAASNVERARINVQRRLKDAIHRVAEHDAALGRYLDATVRTGTYCVYRPV